MSLFTKLKVGLMLAITLAANDSFALRADRDQPITIDADTAERDELAGTTTYSGNVQMKQGSMRIDADQIVIHNTKDKVTKVVARGNPAQYQQKPNENEGRVIARANLLEYLIAEESLRLIEGASLKQEGTSLSGSSIVYDVRQSVVKASGNEKQNERVHMVIPPKALRSDDGQLPPNKTSNPLPASQGNSAAQSKNTPPAVKPIPNEPQETNK